MKNDKKTPKRKTQKKYKFHYSYSKKYDAIMVTLKDGTRVFLWLKKAAMSIDYPKKLVEKCIEKQKDRDFIVFEWSLVELEAIQKGFEKATKMREKIMEKNKQTHKKKKK